MIIFNIYITNLIERANAIKNVHIFLEYFPNMYCSIDYYYQLLVGEFPCRAFEQANGQDLPVRIYGLHIMEFNI